MLRAGFFAFSATDAFIVINGCDKISNRNGAVFANLLTFHATDTTRFTNLSGFGALVGVFAGNNGAGIGVDNSYNLLRAGGNAFSATAAKLFVHNGNPVNNRYRIVLANGGAVAKSHTAVTAGGGARGNQRGGGTRV